MCEAWMNNLDAVRAYGFERGEEFEKIFNAVSVESILLWVMAACVHVVEELMDVHREEVREALDKERAHRPRWYRDKVLEFMPGRVLAEDGTGYDTEGMSEEETEMARVVKHAVAVESADASVLTIKVAGESGGHRTPLSDEDAELLRGYIGEIKDAGVRVWLVNMEGDRFDCEVDVYHDALSRVEEVRQGCEKKISGYLENLPFNGEYSNMALVNALQEVTGVKIVELKWSRAQGAGETTTSEIDARWVPLAGWFKAGDITINMKSYGRR